jgi:predicted nucleic acid-binding protein
VTQIEGQLLCVHSTGSSLRRSSAKSLSISSTMAELLYGARLREDNTSIMAAVRAFLARISVHPWDEAAAEAYGRIRVWAKRLGRSAGVFDIMIAAHAETIGATPVTSDVAFKNMKIRRLKDSKLVGFTLA